MPMRSTGIREAVQRLGTFPTELRAELTTAISAAAQLVLDKAESNAQPSIKGRGYTKASFSGTDGGAVVGFHELGFPHAGFVRVMEGDGSGPTQFFHEVYGNPNAWRPQMTDPFLGPATDEERPAVEVLIAEAVHKALS